MAGWFFSFDFGQKWRQIGRNRAALAMLAFFVITLAGMIYTSNSSEGWQEVGVKISLLLFPLSLGSLASPLSGKQVNALLKAYAIAMTLSAVYLQLRALSFYLWEGQMLFHNDFVVYSFISVHYYALYLVFAIFILLHFLLQPAKARRWQLPLGVFAIAVLTISLMVCAARLQLLLLLLGVSILLFYHYRRKLPMGRMLGLQLSFIAGLALLAMLIPTSQKRIIEAYREVRAFSDSDSPYQTNHRVYIWKHGLKVVAENFWLGSGTGAANDLLYEKLKHEEARFWESYTSYYTLARKKYNFHNAYLQAFAGHGILGLLIVLGIFILAFRQMGPPQFISLLFLLFTALSFLTESMLERQAGTLFFSFFYGLLIILPASRACAPQTAD